MHFASDPVACAHAGAYTPDNLLDLRAYHVELLRLEDGEEKRLTEVWCASLGAQDLGMNDRMLAQAIGKLASAVEDPEDESEDCEVRTDHKETLALCWSASRVMVLFLVYLPAGCRTASNPCCGTASRGSCVTGCGG